MIFYAPRLLKSLTPGLEACWMHGILWFNSKDGSLRASCLTVTWSTSVDQRCDAIARGQVGLSHDNPNRGWSYFSADWVEFLATFIVSMILIQKTTSDIRSSTWYYIVNTEPVPDCIAHTCCSAPEVILDYSAHKSHPENLICDQSVSFANPNQSQSIFLRLQNAWT